MTNRAVPFALTAALLMLSALPLASAPASEIPAGTRFLVELRDKLKAKKVKRGKKFDARTLEALRSADGAIIPAGTKLKGRVTYAKKDELVLRFEEIRLNGRKQPIVTTVVGVVSEKGVKSKAGREGEIEAKGTRAKSAAIGAAVGGGLGTAAGVVRKKGRKDTAITAGAGAAAGAALGALAGGAELELHKGTRLELQLDRPLVFRPKS